MVKRYKPTDEEWLIIKTKYEAGDPVRKIEAEFNVASSTIQSRAKKGGWGRDLVHGITTVTTAIEQFAQSVRNEQKPAVVQQLKDTVDKVFDLKRLENAINNIDMDAVRLHEGVIQEIINQRNSGAITAGECARALALEGLTVKDIASRNGLSKDSAKITNQNNVQINNEDRTLKIKLVE